MSYVVWAFAPCRTHLASCVRVWKSSLPSTRSTCVSTVRTERNRRSATSLLVRPSAPSPPPSLSPRAGFGGGPGAEPVEGGQCRLGFHHSSRLVAGSRQGASQLQPSLGRQQRAIAVDEERQRS